MAGNMQTPFGKTFSGVCKIQEQLKQCKQVTVIGSGQSAAECVLALFNSLTPEQVKAGASIRWITRSAGFHPMEYSKLGQECFTLHICNISKACLEINAAILLLVRA